MTHTVNTFQRALSGIQTNGRCSPDGGARATVRASLAGAVFVEPPGGRYLRPACGLLVPCGRWPGPMRQGPGCWLAGRVEPGRTGPGPPATRQLPSRSAIALSRFTAWQHARPGVPESRGSCESRSAQGESVSGRYHARVGLPGGWIVD